MRNAKEIEPPCYGCTDRHVGCHDENECKKWKEYQEIKSRYYDENKKLFEKIDIDCQYIGENRRRFKLIKQRRFRK